MGKTSKDLLQLEQKDPSSSSLESSLLVCKTELKRKKINTDEIKPKAFVPLPQSQFLGKVRDFLGVMSESNKRLELDAKENSKSFDIEALTGDEFEVIEMDLMLGVADLHTPEAVAAAESAISGYQPVIDLADSSSDSDSDDSSDEDGESENDDNDLVNESMKLKRSPKSVRGKSSVEVQNSKSKKRPKIVEL